MEQDLPEQKNYEQLRSAMLTVINAHALATGEETGRPVLEDTVLAAMLETPRHRFVPQEFEDFAYEDCPVPIGHDKTISQPFIVALMIDLLDVQASDRVLEVGTGLGYQAAVLSHIAQTVFTIDIIPELAQLASETLTELAYDNVHVRTANGAYGWTQQAPFDKIIVAASADQVTTTLLDQIAHGGRLIMTVGTSDDQNLVLVQ